MPGAPLAVPGLGFFGSPCVFGGIRSVIGRIKFGRIAVRGEAPVPNVKVRVSATGFLSVVTGLRAFLPIAWFRMVASRERSLSLGFNSA